jgi:Thrombospondin type 3 repeat
MISGRIALGFVLLVPALGLSLYLPEGFAGATTFTPQFGSPVAFTDTTPGGHPNITTVFNIPQPSAFGDFVNFNDSALTTATDAQAAPGSYVGTVTTTAQVGILNGGCSTNVSPNLNLVDAATPATTALLMSGPEGNLAEDDGDLDENGSVEQPALANNGIADGAEAYPISIRDRLDPDGPGGPLPPVAPAARYFGVDVVFGSVIVIQIVNLQPGDLAAFPNQSWITPAWGAPPSLIILGEPGPPENGDITDFCNLFSNFTLLGASRDNQCTPTAGAPAGCSATGGGFTVRKAVDAGCPGSTSPNECGSTLITNPASTSTLTSRVYAASERDYDNDGRSNQLDVCATIANSVWDPYAFNLFSGNDSDGDGAPNPCDIAPGGNSDQDADGWPNRLDNCPGAHNSQQPGNGGGTTPNTFQWDQDVPPEMPAGDGGPPSDGIGPACDIVANGANLTPTGANGHYHATVIVSHICIGLAGSDSDGDGVCNLQEPSALSCAGGVNDNDCDNDGVGDRLDNCIAGANAPAAGFAQSQRDLDANGSVDVIRDLATVTGVFGAEGGNPNNDGVGDSGTPGYEGRLDLNNNSVIDIIGDISLVAGVAFQSC